MKTTIITLILLTLTFAATSTAKEITLKKNFFTGWKYSTNGKDFKGVGMSGKSLRFEMEGNDDAVAEMNIYKSRQVWVAVFGWPGGAMAGWACGSAIAGNWSETDGYLLGIGLGMGVISALFEASATRHLKKAVSIYNGEEQALMFDLNFRKSALASNGQLTLSLSYNF